MLARYASRSMATKAQTDCLFRLVPPGLQLSYAGLLGVPLLVSYCALYREWMNQLLGGAGTSSSGKEQPFLENCTDVGGSGLKSCNCPSLRAGPTPPSH